MVRGLSRPARLFAVLLVVEAGLMGMLMTMNLLWFVPCLGARAGAGRLPAAALGLLAARKTSSWRASCQYQAFGWCCSSPAASCSAGATPTPPADDWSFDLFELAGVPPAGKFQTAAFYLLFYGLAHAHAALPAARLAAQLAQHGLIAVAPALLLGVKVGIYGMLRFVLPLTPRP